MNSFLKKLNGNTFVYKFKKEKKKEQKKIFEDIMAKNFLK